MQQWHLHMSTRISRRSLRGLSSRVCHEYRLCPRSCMRAQQMRGSLSGHVRSKCIVLCIQSRAYVHLSDRNDWQCLCSMFHSRRYDQCDRSITSTNVLIMIIVGWAFLIIHICKIWIWIFLSLLCIIDFLLLILFALSLRDTKCKIAIILNVRYPEGRSLLALALRTQQCLSRKQRATCVLVCDRISRHTASMQAGMYCQFRVSSDRSV